MAIPTASFDSVKIANSLDVGFSVGANYIPTPFHVNLTIHDGDNYTEIAPALPNQVYRIFQIYATWNQSPPWVNDVQIVFRDQFGTNFPLFKITADSINASDGQLMLGREIVLAQASSLDFLAGINGTFNYSLQTYAGNAGATASSMTIAIVGVIVSLPDQ